ncbi:hypothetical protein HanIR_Chr04g0181801 [Helianthus annuus]|nr:hypothetical protein HanIR_Chr04g0181801 [Helianthus annuus]
MFTDSARETFVTQSNGVKTGPTSGIRARSSIARSNTSFSYQISAISEPIQIRFHLFLHFLPISHGFYGNSSN